MEAKEKIITIEDSFRVLRKTNNSAAEVAEYLLSLDPKREYFTKNTISFDSEEEQLIKELLEGNFRLNKMLHMCQIFHCVKYQKPLFRELMMAFNHGAVVYKVYINFYQLYEMLQKPKIHLTSDEQNFIKKVFYYFKKNDNLRLRHFSHQDPAWELGRENENDLMPLTQELIAHYTNFFDDTLTEIEGR